MSSVMTGSQKVAGANPASSTTKSDKTNQVFQHFQTNPNSYTQLAIPLDHLIETQKIDYSLGGGSLGAYPTFEFENRMERVE